MKSSGLKVIALDFDGTLVESNQIKDHAFEAIFSDWSEHTETMMRWHIANNSIERREKFRYFVEEVLVEPGNSQLVDKLTERFSELTCEAIIECPWVEGAQEFLKFYKGKIPLYLVSATPKKELDKIIARRGLKYHFKRTYGAPINKSKALKEVMADGKASHYETLYIGDSPEDQQVAQNLDVHFIGVDSGRGLISEGSLIMNEFQSILQIIEKNYVFE